MNKYRIKSQQHQPPSTVKSFDFLRAVIPSKLLICTDSDSGEESGSNNRMSCRQRAEAFARRLQFRLRSLGSQEPSTGDQASSSNQHESEISASTEDETNQQSSMASSIIPAQMYSTNGNDTATEITIKHFSNKSIQIDGGKIIPRRNSIDNEILPQSYYDIGLDGDADGDIDDDDADADDDADEDVQDDVDYGGGGGDGDGGSNISCGDGKVRHHNVLVNDENSMRTISGESLSSSDCQFFDPETASLDYYDCYGDENISSSNDMNHTMSELYENSSLNISSDSCSESLPNSQSTTTFTANNTSSSTSNNTLQDDILSDLCILSKESDITSNMCDCPDASDETDSSINRLQHLNQQKIKPEMIDDLQSSEVSNCSSDHRRCDDDDFECKPQRVRRCSSLKSGKTPPGTPGHKKFVRFADVLGLDLADVKTFLDEIPTIPQSAYNDLDISYNHDDDRDEIDGSVMLNNIDYRSLYSKSINGGPIIDKILVPLFQQPGGAPGFLDFVRKQNVCLENAIITDPICLTISGTIRVRNLDFNKSVHVRYTLNAWQSYSDLQTNYIENSCDGFSDKFCFIIFGNSLQIGQRIEMAIRFSCKGDQYWDSNFGTNYCFQCLPTNSFAAICGNRKLSTPTTLITTNSNCSNSTQIIITENSSLSLTATSSATTSAILLSNNTQIQNYPAGLGDDSGSGSTDSHKFY